MYCQNKADSLNSKSLGKEVHPLSIRELNKQGIKETSMVNMFYAFLQEASEPTYFNVLCKEILALKGATGKQRQVLTARLFTEINIDGRFKPLGDNLWGLRSWYPVEQFEEVIMTKKTKKKKKATKKKVEPFVEPEELEEDLDDELEDDLALDDPEADVDLDDDEDDDDEEFDEENEKKPVGKKKAKHIDDVIDSDDDFEEDGLKNLEVIDEDELE